jgi:ribosomal protein S27AE
MIGTVYWDEEDKQRDVKKLCQSCQNSAKSHGFPGMKTIDDVALVSSQKIGHLHSFWHGDRTACGKDATGEEWWWRY